MAFGILSIKYIFSSPTLFLEYHVYPLWRKCGYFARLCVALGLIIKVNFTDSSYQLNHAREKVAIHSWRESSTILRQERPKGTHAFPWETHSPEDLPNEIWKRMGSNIWSAIWLVICGINIILYQMFIQKWLQWYSCCIESNSSCTSIRLTKVVNDIIWILCSISSLKLLRLFVLFLLTSHKLEKHIVDGIPIWYVCFIDITIYI